MMITSHRLIARWGRPRLLLLISTCSRVLSSFSFYRRRYLHPLPSNVLTKDSQPEWLILEWVILDNLAVSDLSRVIPWVMILRFEHSTLWVRAGLARLRKLWGGVKNFLKNFENFWKILKISEKFWEFPEKFWKF